MYNYSKEPCAPYAKPPPPHTNQPNWARSVRKTSVKFALKAIILIWLPQPQPAPVGSGVARGGEQLPSRWSTARECDLSVEHLPLAAAALKLVPAGHLKKSQPKSVIIIFLTLRLIAVGSFPNIISTIKLYHSRLRGNVRR
jgi:hypothetical protein